MCLFFCLRIRNDIEKDFLGVSVECNSAVCHVGIDSSQIQVLDSDALTQCQSLNHCLLQFTAFEHQAASTQTWRMPNAKIFQRVYDELNTLQYIYFFQFCIASFSKINLSKETLNSLNLSDCAYALRKSRLWLPKFFSKWSDIVFRGRLMG